jgi:REP-associated tyrosine transposase
MPQEFPNRRSTRIQGYDYSQPGYYHVVICTYQSKWLFGNIVENEACLNKVGQIAHEIWLTLPLRFDCVDLDYYVIMPNHIHGIVVIKEQHQPQNPKIAHMPDRFQPYWQQQEQPVGPIDLSEIVRTFKASTTYHARREGNMPDFAWHSGYFERIIAHERYLSNAQSYILNNPVQWQLNHRGWEAADFKWARTPSRSRQ